MKQQLINYETILSITKAISHSRDPEEIALMTTESIKTAMEVKGCSLFLFNRKTNELELAASGLSDEYINKGPVSALKSIAQSLKEGPVAIYDVMDDPRIQYPDEAQKEGIVMARYIKGLKSSIDVLKTMKEVQTQKTTRRTPYEGVPVSVASNKIGKKGKKK